MRSWSNEARWEGCGRRVRGERTRITALWDRQGEIKLREGKETEERRKVKGIEMKG